MTAIEFLQKEDLPTDFLSGDDVNYAMIEFAKYHVETANKQWKILFSELDDPYPLDRDDDLSDIYPLENIK